MLLLSILERVQTPSGIKYHIHIYSILYAFCMYSCTGMGTICNMGAEIGATTSMFGYTPSMGEYLHATNRGYIADECNALSDELLRADNNCEYDEVISIDLSQLRPAINGPYTPDLRNELGQQITESAAKNNWPIHLSASLIGSCTNSSYEDLSRVANLCQQALDYGLVAKVPFFVSPGSEQVRATMERDGIQAILESAGAVMLSNSCGPCIGQWKRRNDEHYDENVPNSIVTSFNRNFSKRNDGNPLTHGFVTSPEICTMFAFAGDITFDPDKDSIDGFRFRPPTGMFLLLIF